ncbi:spore germination protein GerPE [Oceanobacillus kapialis]|uniref:Spore germination protein GerPE n=1 Tax=Oceanobacillus kapialis TaxID=481353 RepID=A0ABW5Q481_9BACI
MTNIRTASVNQIRVNSVSFCGIFSIGDTETAHQTSRGIALQKEGNYFTKEGQLYFTDYPLFNMKPVSSIMKEDVQMERYDHNPNIHVQRIDANGVTTSSIMQIGSLRQVEAVAWLKHIRELID